jgi:hypothetical protein
LLEFDVDVEGGHMVGADGKVDKLMALREGGLLAAFLGWWCIYGMDDIYL